MGRGTVEVISKTFSVSENIAHTSPILIETSVSDKGIPLFEIYGLVSKSIEESKKRIVTAFENSDLDFPLKNIKVNIAPASISKDGTHFDLAIAYTILEPTLKSKSKSNSIFLGELSFDGSISRLENILFLCVSAIRQGFKTIYLPASNVQDVSLLSDVEVIPVSYLRDLLKFDDLKPLNPRSNSESEDVRDGSTFRSIRGNNIGKKIIQYSIIGNHHFLIEGYPGVGKSMLVKSMLDLLPPLNIDKATEVSQLFSYVGLSRTESEFFLPPFRSPHQTSSYSAILGTYGNRVYPGEVSLSNYGVLFLDEIPEFNRLVLEGLRSPLEDGYISISRSKNKVTFKTNFILASTRNPCRCGYFNHHKVGCKCSPIEIRKYQNKISGPILDRIDLFYFFESKDSSLEVTENNVCTYFEYISIRQKLFFLKEKRSEILYKSLNKFNHSLIDCLLSKLDLKAKEILNDVKNNYSLSNRSVLKILNLAFTVALFNNREIVNFEDILEASSFRYRSMK